MKRREFVGQVAGIGLALSACGKAADAPAGGSDAELGPIEKELNIYNWSDYMTPETVSNFEQEFGVRINYDTFESNEEMVAKLAAGASGYDIVVPSSYIIPAMRATGLAAPLHKRYLTNLSNLAPTFVSPEFDPGNTYSIAYQWGTTGIAYRTDRIDPPTDSWAVFHDTRYRDKMTQMDDQREVIGSWLRYRGKSLNSVNASDLSQAKADAIAAKRNLKAYVSAPVKDQLISGDVWVAQLWNGVTEQARSVQPAIGYVVPKEGCTIWADSWVIPRTAPHKRAAHEWINYMLRPEVAAAIANFTGYGTANATALPMMRTPMPYPTEAETRRLEYQQDLVEHTVAWDQLWTEIKSG